MSVNLNKNNYTSALGIDFFLPSIPSTGRILLKRLVRKEQAVRILSNLACAHIDNNKKNLSQQSSWVNRFGGENVYVITQYPCDGTTLYGAALCSRGGYGG